MALLVHCRNCNKTYVQADIQVDPHFCPTGCFPLTTYTTSPPSDNVAQIPAKVGLEREGWDIPPEAA